MTGEVTEVGVSSLTRDVMSLLPVLLAGRDKGHTKPIWVSVI